MDYNQEAITPNQKRELLILLTGAAGKTGKAILNTLLPHGVRVRSLVRSEQQAEALRKTGVKVIAIGDLRDPLAIARALEGVSKIYYICPNMAPDELEIGRMLIDLAKQNGLSRFVYHSVLHPQAEDMPHHWQKMRMEEELFKSGLDFTILQPCAYMQNIQANWQSIVADGVYAIPYTTTARISLVDLADVAAAAEVVLTQLNHANAIYELAGPEPLSQQEVAEILSEKLQRPVRSETLDRAKWVENARSSGLNLSAIKILHQMFEYYENYGLVGNANILTYLIKRPATKFTNFVQKLIDAEKRNPANGNSKI